MAERIEALVIGAGAVGLAIGRALALSGIEVAVIDRGSNIGTETSSRNSEVVHAGIYYPSGSLKARLCVEGRHLLYEFCERQGVAFRRTRKTDRRCRSLRTATTPQHCSSGQGERRRRHPILRRRGGARSGTGGSVPRRSHFPFDRNLWTRRVIWRPFAWMRKPTEP